MHAYSVPLRTGTCYIRGIFVLYLQGYCALQELVMKMNFTQEVAPPFVHPMTSLPATPTHSARKYGVTKYRNLSSSVMMSSPSPTNGAQVLHENLLCIGDAAFPGSPTHRLHHLRQNLRTEMLTVVDIPVMFNKAMDTR